MSTNQNVLLRKKLLLSVLSLVDGINGRKKLQKMIYLTDSLGWNLFDDYRFYLYGPYSDGLYYELQNLKEAGLISEVKKNESFSYTLTNNGKSLLEILNSQNLELESKTKELINELSSYSSEDLEIMASLYYIANEQDQGSEELIEELHRRKPHLSKEKIRPALKIFKMIKK